MIRLFIYSSLAVAVGLVYSPLVRAAEGDLQILSPAGSSVFHLGDAVEIRVKRKSTATKQITLIGDLVSRLPAAPEKVASDITTFTITLDRDWPEGNYAFGAVDTTPPTRNPINYSTPSEILVVSSVPLVPPYLAARPQQITLSHIGDEVEVVTLGIYKNLSAGSNVSGLAKLTSLDPKIATIENGRNVVANRSGETKIRSDFLGRSILIPVSVKATTSADLNGDGRVDREDLQILLKWIGRVVKNRRDAKDLDGNGKIDLSDLAILFSRCTYARCGSFQGDVGEDARKWGLR